MMLQDIDENINPTETERTIKKRKYKQPSLEEDPLQYHAKPKDLASTAIAVPQANVEETRKFRSTITRAIFAKVGFQDLPLSPKLIEQLQRNVVEGGLGLSNCTFVQSATIPLLINKRQNLFMKSQTGSGKTLSYLLPIINQMMQFNTKVRREDGTMALIIAPTRELCSQIFDVLTKILRCCVWIVAGSLSGGEKKKSEKARLRKGINILVSTPGRLLDHLKTTESFNLQRLNWIVLDEADRLLDMGFEQSILEILSLIRGENLPGMKIRSNDDSSLTSLQRRSKDKSLAAKKCSNIKDIAHVLVSATMTEMVTTQLALPIMSTSKQLVVVDADKQLVETAADFKALKQLIKRVNEKHEKISGILDMRDDDELELKPSKKARGLGKDELLETPKQLNQYFMMVTCKWRLAALFSFIKTHAHQKIVVFLSTCDSVDFHSLLFREVTWATDLDPAIDTNKRSNKQSFLDPLPIKFTGIAGESCAGFRLHGNMPQHLRNSVFKDFTSASNGVLFCTDVAARGLDLPNVDWILQYDAPLETTDYVHRIGRTARRGHYGSAVIFLLPAEASYIHLLQTHGLCPQALSLLSLFSEVANEIPGSHKFKNVDEMAAVILQRRLERVVYNNKFLELSAQQAFRSFTRAYATHSNDSKNIFKIHSLHLGHVAKSFALRESPPVVKSSDDIIGKVMNGEMTFATLYPVLSTQDKKLKRQLRDKKYALSNKNRGVGMRISGDEKRKFNETKQKTRSVGPMGLEAGKAPSVSGKFRKSGGYFRKKLRDQTNSEFSS